MGLLWITLPAAWDLPDVQAFCNVVVNILAASFAFVVARLCWVAGAAKAFERRRVRLGALLSINTLGEVYDACRLLHLGLLSTSHWRILSQCVVITALAIITFLSGIIVRFSTQWTTEITPQMVSGLLANRQSDYSSHEIMLWNSTWESLNKANFPQDRLLDYLPDLTEDWRYVESDWSNSSWSLHCEHTEKTAIMMSVVDVPCNENTSYNDQIPAFEAIFPQNAWNAGNDTYQWVKFEGFQDETTFEWHDMLLFRSAFSYITYDSAEIASEMEVTLLAVHMVDVPGYDPDNDTYCEFKPGPIDSASYTKAVCKVSKTEPTEQGEWYVDIAHPDNNGPEFLVKAYNDYFQAKFFKEHREGLPITVTSPSDLVRFYQTFLISQDTQVSYQVDRMINLAIEVVQISTLFLAFCGLVTVLTGVGMLRYVIFWLRHSSAFSETPQSKIDWMIQSVEGGTRSSRVSFDGGQKTGYSVTSMLSPEGSPKMGRRKSDFETATYGLSPGKSHAPPLSRYSSGGSYFPLVPTTSQPDDSQTHLISVPAITPAGPLVGYDGVYSRH